MMQVSQYRYILKSISWILEDEEIMIDRESIISIILDYNYDKLNRPMMYLNCNLKTSLYNNIAKNSDKSKILVVLYKYDSNQDNPIKEVDIKCQFDYTMPSTESIASDLSEGSESEKLSESSYKNCIIGLMQSESINNNKKKLGNNVYVGITKATLIYLGLKHMPALVMEQLDSNDRLERVPMPPIDKVTGYLKYIDDMVGIYSSGYRYFDDYNVTYLLSEKGVPIRNGDNTFDTIIINVEKALSKNTLSVGMIIDNKTESYQIYVNNQDAKFTLADSIAGKSVTNIVKVYNDGSTTNVKINKESKSSSTNTIYKRDYSYKEGVNSINSLGTKIDAEKYNVTLTFSKENIDPSLITPNKEYIVKTTSYPEYNGRYILFEKQVVLKKENDEYIPTTSILLRKVNI